MKIIENTKDLETFCKTLSKKDFITIDLEFLREKSYFAHLCLIQVAAEDDAAIIDPLAENIDLKVFFQLMQNKKVLKVFHSGRQDIEIIYHLSGAVPTPVFDTQIAAMVCGFGESVSYETLVAEITQTALDKTCRLSDWSKRPLSTNQLEYAISDVTHLTKIYRYLERKLKETGREKWLEEEVETLNSKDTYFIEPSEAWHKIRHRSHNQKFLTILKELAAWREKRAQIKDIPRQNVIKDDLLLVIAAAAPKTQEELEQMRNIRKDLTAGKIANEILAAVKKALETPPNKYVKLEPEQKFNGSAGALLELLRLLLKIKSGEEGVVARLIADDEDLKKFAISNDLKNPILKGWRYKIFGREALALREGNLSIGYNKSKRKIEITIK